MTNERDNLDPSPKLAVMPRKSDVFAERHETLLVAFMIVMSFSVSVATVYGSVLAVKWFLS